MIIKSATFIKGSTSIEQCPPDDVHEYAFIGRSNVGKSSLINMLTGNKKLAKTSSTPGKTQQINHFKINESWNLVDLPGYGYAKTGKNERDKWEKFIRDYIINRSNLVCLFVLVDARLEPQKIDIEFINWLGDNEVPFAIIFTKLDKLSNAQFERNKKKYLNFLKQQWSELPEIFYTSSETRKGKEEVLDFIEHLNETVTFDDTNETEQD